MEYIVNKIMMNPWLKCSDCDHPNMIIMKEVPESELSAHHLRVLLSPVVITHCAPVSRMIHLQTALPRVISIHQPHHSICNTPGQETAVYLLLCVSQLILCLLWV